MPAWLYILRLGSGRFYFGVTTRLATRRQEHLTEVACKTTKEDAPHALLYTEEYPAFSAARLREAQIKRWSHARKEALIAGDFRSLHSLAKRRSSKPQPLIRMTHDGVPDGRAPMKIPVSRFLSDSQGSLCGGEPP